jgi:hypothetical protein
MLQREYSDLIDENSSEKHPSLSSEQLSKNNQYFLYDQELLNRHFTSLPPIEAYLYFPKRDEQVIVNPKNKEDILRMIFNNVKFTSFEDKKLRKLYEEIRKNNMNNKDNFQFPKYWIDSETIRFLQASDFKINNAIKIIKETVKWNDSYYPFQINDRIKYILNSGLMFLCGKDKRFRPVIICQAKKCSILLSEKFQIEEIQEAIIYFLNYVIQYHLIPGQIENWIIISDLNNVGITELGDFKKILDIMSKYRGRVFRNFVIRMGGLLKFSLKGVLNLVGSTSIKKIKVLDKDEIFQNLSEYINPYYIPVTYGGYSIIISEELNNYLFPFELPEVDYSNDLPNDILSENEYKIKCLESNNKPIVICPILKQKWDEEEELRILMEEEERKRKKLEEEKEIAIRNIKTLRAKSIDEWKSYIKEISDCIIPQDEDKIVSKYIPIKCDIVKINSNLNIINNYSPFSTGISPLY